MQPQPVVRGHRAFPWVAAYLAAAAVALLAGCQAPHRASHAAAPSSGAATASVSRSQAGTPASRVATAPVPAPPAAAPAPPPKPEPSHKEMVIAWNASLLYLLEDGKPIGKPFIINAAQAQFLRSAHLGDFTITEKIREWRSNLFDVHGKPLPDKSMAETDGAVMRNWMRVGDSAVGLHYSPAFHFFKDPEERHRSHGCYRMAKADSDFVFKWAPVGTPIHVVRSLAGTKWAFLREVTPARLLAHAESGGADTPKRRKHRRHRAE